MTTKQADSFIKFLFGLAGVLSAAAIIGSIAAFTATTSKDAVHDNRLDNHENRIQLLERLSQDIRESQARIESRLGIAPQKGNDEH